MSPEQRELLSKHLALIQTERRRISRIPMDRLLLNSTVTIDPFVTPTEIGDEIRQRVDVYRDVRDIHNRRRIDTDQLDAKLRETYMEIRQRALGYARFDPTLHRRFGAHDDPLLGLDEILRWAMEVMSDTVTMTAASVGHEASPLYSFGPGRQVRRGGEAAELSPQQFHILRELQNNNYSVPVSILYKRVWKGTYNNDRHRPTVQRALCRLNNDKLLSMHISVNLRHDDVTALSNGQFSDKV